MRQAQNGHGRDPPLERRGILHLGPCGVNRIIAKRNWILTLRGPALYGFVHRTFLEYLCAAELIRQFQDREIEFDELRDRYVLARADDDSWREIIRLLVAQLSNKHARNLITALVPEAEKTQSQQSDLALAFQCLAEQEPYKLHDFTDAYEKTVNGLYGWLSLSVLASYSIDFTATEQIHTSLTVFSSMNWLPTNFTHRDLPCVRNNIFGHPDVFEWGIKIISAITKILAWQSSDELKAKLVIRIEDKRIHFMERCVMLGVFCEFFSNDQKTRDLVEGYAVRDEHAHVRRVALTELAQHFHDSAEVLALLVRRAIEDPAASVRSQALEALAQHFHDADAVRLLLLRRAVEDPDASPRMTTMWALARHFCDAAEVGPLLLRRAVEDEAKGVRQVAIFAWAQAYREQLEQALVSWALDERLRPGVDPREPITLARVEEAAAKLGKSTDEIRAAYEKLVEELPLKLEWRMPPDG